MSTDNVRQVLFVSPEHIVTTGGDGVERLVLPPDEETGLQAIFLFSNTNRQAIVLAGFLELYEDPDAHLRTILRIVGREVFSQSMIAIFLPSDEYVDKVPGIREMVCAHTSMPVHPTQSIPESVTPERAGEIVQHFIKTGSLPGTPRIPTPPAFKAAILELPRLAFELP